jgi:hypothetical protein
VRRARSLKLDAEKAMARLEADLAAEEAAKAALVSDLNSLVLQSTMQQFKALETLQSRMDGLAARVGPERSDGVAVTLAVPSSPHVDASAAPTDPRPVEVARAEMEAAAAVAAAAEARSRHVALPPRGGGKAAKVQAAEQTPVAVTGAGGFTGFS